MHCTATAVAVDVHRLAWRLHVSDLLVLYCSIVSEIDTQCTRFCAADMNHIIHACSHPRWRASAYESENEIFYNIQEYLERLISICKYA